MFHTNDINQKTRYHTSNCNCDIDSDSDDSVDDSEDFNGDNAGGSKDDDDNAVMMLKVDVMIAMIMVLKVIFIDSNCNAGDDGNDGFGDS